ncbi:MAG TPA: pseudouridine synthase [Magnetospirillaceae bacterium]|nr:pseudouridine synthase [Magnetospirillaceae bacterium]
MIDDPIRVNKFIAQHLHIGRRAADDLINDGKVMLNGSAPSLGARVSPDDVVVVDGTRIHAAATPLTYLLIDKPTGYVCSRRQQGDTPTIYQLLKPEHQHLKAVGRLDKDSSGILLLTNDGDYAHQLTHPSFAKTKRYEVALDRPLAPLHRQMISDHGITLPDGPSKLQLERQHDDNDHAWIVAMHEGRNRQIRRTFAALGYEVTALRRTNFGPFSLHDLGDAKQRIIPKPA